LAAPTQNTHTPTRPKTNATTTPTHHPTSKTKNHIKIVSPGLQLILDPLLWLASDAGAAMVHADNRHGGDEGEDGGAGDSAGDSDDSASSSAGFIPRIVHMTLRSKHRVLPHQVLSVLSWGRANPGYALLLYDDADIDAYMQKCVVFFVFKVFFWGGGVKRVKKKRRARACATYTLLLQPTRL
jgi:hypothetical protein